MRIGEFRIDCDGVAIGGFGLFEPTLYPENVAHIRARSGSRRIESDRFSQVLKRLIQPATFAEQTAKQIVRIGVMRHQIERFAVGALGRLQLAGLMMLQAMPDSIGDFGVLFPGCGVRMLPGGSGVLGNCSLERCS